MAAIEIERPSAHVAEVWLNRPDLRNAFNAEAISGLRQAFDGFAGDPDLRAVLVGGRGKSFCAGADLNWMRQTAEYDWERNRAEAEAMAEMLWRVASCPVPVIARIHGDCFAGGLGLAAACDIRVAAVGVQFCLSEVRLGLIPATISPYVIRAIGDSAARRWFVTAERFGAEAALRAGLVQECVDPAGLDSTIGSILAAIVANGPQAVRAAKRLIRDCAGTDPSPEWRAETARRIADIRAGDEGREGVGSFLERRRPTWIVD